MTREEAIKELKIFSGTTRIRLSANFWEALNTVIKALEQETCEDAVSRQSVKDGMIKYGFHAPDMTVTEFVEDMLPPVIPTQRWIPCSKELPKESGFYLVSTIDCITIMEFCKGWISQNIGSCNWYVKAWQPLPKPYKEESEE